MRVTGQGTWTNAKPIPAEEGKQFWNMVSLRIFQRLSVLSPVKLHALCTLVTAVLAIVLLAQSFHLQSSGKKTATGLDIIPVKRFRAELVFNDLKPAGQKVASDPLASKVSSFPEKVAPVPKIVLPFPEKVMAFPQKLASVPEKANTTVRPSVKSSKNHGASAQPVSDEEIAALTQILQMRLAQAEVDLRVVSTKTCASHALRKDVRSPCVNTTCPRSFDKSPERRIRQLVVPQLSLTSEQHDAIRTLAADVKPQKYILVTAASSNHYRESQAFIYNLRKFLFSRLNASEYSFYYFDLGLKPLERRRVIRNCNCTVKDMSFVGFPNHTKKVNCYAWKPLIIKALLPKADVLVYMDVSVRFPANMDVDTFFNTARKWGAQFLMQHDSLPNHTLKSMFDFYGDLPCMYAPFPELLAGFSVFHNEPFMQKVILNPWVACALNASCMCPMENPNTVRLCPHKERLVGQCHRFDLSALTMQFAKLYGAKFGHLVMQTNNHPNIHRNEVMNFFTD